MNAPLQSDLKIDPAFRHDPRPRSAVSTMTGVVGLVGLFAWTAAARAYGMVGPLAALTALFACGVPMVLWSVLVDKVHRNPTTGIDWDAPLRPWKESADISLAKIVGLWGIWAVIAAFYCIARWYWDGGYLFSMYVLGVAAVPLLIVSIPYVFWLDRRLKEPKDGAWHFGQLLIGRADLVDREQIYHYFRAWAVKAFFTAFMFSIIAYNWAHAIEPASADVTADPVALAQWLIAVMFMIDVSFATVGYLLTLKPLDGHIRTANPYAAGWTAALICYPPFALMGGGGPLDYHVGTLGEDGWAYWLQAWPLATAGIAVLLVFLTGVYAWATVAFGYRFSNLTDRGIITNGPYAWTKHPAYVSKNLFWWLATVPMLATTGSMVDAIRNTAVLAVVSGVYYWRARTEERHLSADPHYRDYAAWMERNGPITRFVNWTLGPLSRRSRPAVAAAAEPAE
jgi:protein-S-isoprenylcysteine O-methyltransferase Ste14